jgi:integrase
VNVAELRDAWLAEISASRTASTVTHYRKRTQNLVLGLGSREVAAVAPADVQTVIDLAAVGKAADTIRGTTVSVQQFGKWLVRRGHIPAIWPIEWPKPKSREREIVATHDEVQRLLEKATPAFRSIYRALRLTGARPGELCRATIAMIDRRQHLIVIAQHKTVAKTGRPRKIAIAHPALQELLESAIAGRDEGPIWLTERGRQWTVANLSRQFRVLRDSAGLPSEIVLYSTRHEHATQIYAQTGEIAAVADALGHSSLQTSRRYAKVSAETLGKRQNLFKE